MVGTNSAEHTNVVLPCPGGPNTKRFRYRSSMVFGVVIRNGGGFGSVDTAGALEDTFLIGTTLGAAAAINPPLRLTLRRATECDLASHRDSLPIE